MRIARLETLNWLPYRGRNALDLDGIAYGVTARRVVDRARSNWTGKTSLLNAVRFALFGDHPKATEDEWITNGEGEGRVTLTLSDGLAIERRRVKGESTGLIVRPPGIAIEMTGAIEPKCPKGSAAVFSVRQPAQELIERWIGLSRRDFLATSFFEQKRMHRFVVARPAERFADVAAWVRLGPLRKAEEETRKKLAALVDRETRLAERARLLRERVRDDPAATLAALGEALREATLEAKKLGEQADRADVRAAEDAERRSLEGRAREHEAVKKELAAIPTPALRRPAATGFRAKAEEAAGVLREARSSAVSLRILARGEFDGICPVASIPCPAKDAINARTEANRTLLVKAEERERFAREELDARRSTADKAEREAREEEQRRTRGAWLRKRVAETEADAARARELGHAPPGDPRHEADEARHAATRAVGKVAAQAAELKAAERDATDLAKVEEEFLTVRHEAQTLREAAAILGRSGAQRRLAEEAVRAIEHGANARLAEAGVELSTRLVWGRETNDLAPACEACGAPFPPGRSTKVCRCGEERGPKVIDELGCELSSVSGAAEDLAGVALSLSAAAWIRGDRMAGWGVALVDEPFGSLDEANRRAMARALAAMLGSAGGFEQALVVAHHEGAMEALPGRIRIVAGPYGSWARVG